MDVPEGKPMYLQLGVSSKCASSDEIVGAATWSGLGLALGIGLGFGSGLGFGLGFGLGLGFGFGPG